MRIYFRDKLSRILTVASITILQTLPKRLRSESCRLCLNYSVATLDFRYRECNIGALQPH
jgi:hypothetical protein